MGILVDIVVDAAKALWALLSTPKGRIVAAFAVGMLIAGVQSWRLSDANKTIEGDAKTISGLTANNHTLKQNQATLQRGLDQQSASINHLGKEAIADTKAAGKAANAVLTADALRKRDAKIAGAGPDVMNQWLKETFDGS